MFGRFGQTLARLQILNIQLCQMRVVVLYVMHPLPYRAVRQIRSV
jgi:hypothetical protein